MQTQNIRQQQKVVKRVAYLQAIDNSGTQNWELKEATLYIGRSSENDICIANPFVSRQHAKIEQKNGDFLLQDLNSQNGTYVNQSCVQVAILQEGDRLRIGKTDFLFTFKKQQRAESLQSKNLAYQQQLQSLPRIASTDLPVLILGESGCGKEMLAKSIHESSLRRKGPLITINCSALSKQVIESELFGHIKGSFTDAAQSRKGAFQAARGGTLVLDEIGDLPLELQPKLLRALENKEIRPLGSDHTIKTDVRIISSTHKNLKHMVSTGDFRKDLFFRLNIIPFHIPKLKNRMEDFEDLLASFAREMRLSFSHEAVLKMKTHSWPGNIRELKNTVSRASALFGQAYTVKEEDLPMIMENQAEDHPVNRPAGMSVFQQIEYDMIKQRLVANNGNQRLTALELGIPKSTLNDKIKRFDINIKDLLKA